MTNIVCIDGTFVPEEEARLPIKLSGLEMGAGVFTVMRLHDGCIECLEEHLERLYAHAGEHGLEAPHIQKEHFRELVVKNSAWQGTFRLKTLIIPTRPEATSWGRCSFVIYLDPYTTPAHDALQMGLQPYVPDSALARIKTLSRLDRRLFWMQAQKNGLHELVMTTMEGVILEALWANLFWIHANTLFTPDPALPYMAGILLGHACRAASALGLQVEYVRSTLDDIPPDAALFITNALIWVKPVQCVKEREFVRNRSFEEKFYPALKEEILKNSSKLLS